jgi:hypothetical protein
MPTGARYASPLCQVEALLYHSGSRPYEVFESFADAGESPRYIVYATVFQVNKAIQLDVILHMPDDFKPRKLFQL